MQLIYPIKSIASGTWAEKSELFDLFRINLQRSYRNINAKVNHKAMRSSTHEAHLLENKSSFSP